MKKICFLGFFLSLIQLGFAQTHTTNFSNASAEKKIKIIVSKGGIDVSTHNSSEVSISTNDYKAPPERARGLKALYNNAEDNTGIGLEVTESGNTITIKKASNEEMDFEIKVPKEVSVFIEESGWEDNGIAVKGVQGEIEVDAKGSDIKIMEVSGSVVASTINGDIEVVYTTLNQKQPNSISCTNGFVDVTLPANSKADLKMKSINGEVYTDLEINTGKSKDGMRHVAGRSISGTLNGGGVEIALRAINSDIYLRKAK